MKKFKSVIALALALVMVLGCVGTAFASNKTAADELKGVEKGNSAASVKELPKGFKSAEFKESNAYQYADDEIVRAIVVLKNAPEVDASGESATAYRRKLTNEHQAVRKAMSGISYEMAYEFTTLLNGFSCDVAYGDLDKIAAIPSVDAVYIANHYAEPEMQKSVRDTKMASSNAFFTGIDDVLGEIGADGTGMVIAVLDTGLNYTHEAFADADGNCAEYGRMTADDAELAVAPGVYINAKVPFAYDYAEKDTDVTDHNGHGTHVSGIAAGCTYDAENDEYTFLGSASGAQIVSMKIFKDAGGGTTDDIYFYALEDAYRLGVDTINMSIGAQNGFTYDASLETEVFGNIYKRLEAAGIVTCVAGGNEYSMAENSSAQYIGPEYQDYGTIASPAAYEGNLSVASIENYLYPSYVITVNGKSFKYSDTCKDDKAWLSVFGDKDVEYVVVPDSTKTNQKSDISLGNPADFTAEGVDVKGKIAIVQRGTLSFEEKVENAADAGAIGCIVVNNDSGLVNMAIETFEIPAISTEQSAVDAFKAADPAVVSTPTTKEYVQNDSAFLMSDFSNWGTSPMLTIDPTVTSVGGMVYSSVQTGDHDYDVYSGTSMASPNFAGTITTVLQYLSVLGAKTEDGGRSWSELTKAERVERAKALLESTAIVLGDADGYPYSVRKQGAGLANAYNALSTYGESGFIIDPIKELGDDASKTGRYTFDVTLTNEGDYIANYLPDITLLYDYVYNYFASKPEQEPLYMNSLTSDVIDSDDITASFSVDGEDVDIITVDVGESVTVTVDIQLSDAIKAQFNDTFPNGNYVEGYVFFDDVELTDDGEVVYYDGSDNAYLYDENGAYMVDYNFSTGEYEAVLGDDGEKSYCEDESALTMNAYASVHATVLAFYGDWTQGDVLESVDFADFIDANNFVNTTVVDADGNTYADYGYTAVDAMDTFYTNPNWAYTAVFNTADQPQKLRYYLGDNLLDYADYYAAHNGFSTAETDADGIYANGVYIEPYQLRNCKSLKMTVTNAETGEVYYVDDTPYLPKAAYDEDNGEWQNYGAFYWTGKDADGNFVPSGTVANITFDAVLPYKDAEVKNVWSFSVEVDYTAPVLESAVFDAEAKTLTVTAKDESYLAAIYLYAEDLGEDAVAAVEAFSSDKAGESFTATFDVTDLLEAGSASVDVTLLDYATNETAKTVNLFETGKDAKITYVTPKGSKEVAVKTGDTYTIEDCTEKYDNTQFVLWVDKEVEDADDSTIFDAVTAMYSAGDEITVNGDLTLYALYAYGEEKQLEVPNYYYDVALDYSGDWAICGLNYADGDYDSAHPLVLDEEGGTKSVIDDLGGTVGDWYVEFYSDEAGIRYTFEKDATGAYTIKNFKTGKYMAVVDGALAFIDEAADNAKWEVISDLDANGAVIRSAQNAKWVLIYNDDEGEFQLVDNTVAIGSFFGLGIYPADYYLNWLYRYADTELDVEGYTTNVKYECKHEKTEIRNAKEPTYSEDGYTGDTYCTICNELVKKGEVIPATGYPTCYYKNFKDCEAEWYHEAVDYVVSNGYMVGLTDDTFAPNGQMTRAMVVTVLYRMAGSPKVTGPSSFTDVPEGQWYSDAIAWAQDNGVVLGVLADKFAPNDYVTREQIATILWRYENSPAAEAKLDSFKDADKISDYAKEAMAWAVSEGIFNGDNGNLKPTDNATRAEFACIVMRYLGGSYVCGSTAAPAAED